MRLLFNLLVVAALTLLASTNAQSIDTVAHQRQRANFESHKLLRSLKTNIEDVVEDSGDVEEERAPKFLTMKQLQKLRKSERIKEIKEVLAIGMVNGKAAAQAAAAAAKNKKVATISTQLDDNAAEMLKTKSLKNEVFIRWHNDGVHPQAIFDALAQPGKYSGAKWNGIAIAYLNFASDMAKAAAKAS
ncbi:hypothetical protein PRIC1_006179 [Phytophthora ramorum]|uniref:uncharacterized protein n=1 Tax=Phytophthora ramorum TaxID=164328 RepID=UPI0030AE7ACB|nr:hypothetical protein KRP23_14476 [Phytophthora ramorum]